MRFRMAAVFATGVCLAAQLGAAVSIESREALSRWAGCWNVEGQELNSQGEMLRQTGVLRTDLAEDGNVLHFRVTYQLAHSTGYYATLPRQRDSRYLIRILPDQRLLAMEYESATGPSPPGRSDVAMSTAGDRMFWSFMFHHPKRDIALFGTVSLRLVDVDHAQGRTLLADPYGDFTETYVQTWKRLVQNDPRCAL